MGGNSLQRRVDSGLALPGSAALHMGASVWWPLQPQSAPAALVCLPGGNMNRRYYDLQPADGDDSFSFARQMVTRGFIVITLDYLALGDSDAPIDGWLLTPDVLTQANVHAARLLLAELREGRLAPGLPPLPELPSLGVGHSMGGMMTILAQALGHLHAGIAALGFSTRGLPEYVSPEVREASRDPAAARERLEEFARAMFKTPTPLIRQERNTGLFGGSKADLKGVAALQPAMDRLLALPAFLSMVPGNVAPEAAAIDVPVFLGLGERDMAGPPHQIPAAFTKSRDVTLYLLPEAGHSHFLFPARVGLFDRLARWGRGVVAPAV